ncbi:uncharacterized protein LY79DRAFT_582618 [Colletotrichum navitas]|uniref:Uncharacterized protein n=1 Tax=Colletotrichum navitas TaxID=681940 RepID=A0AAD8V0P3_9PEZI|nr:uncharacterized protein LY79DRAFT_582618 [Colletotrichum navitas]KAK1579321.1 hypothetical protein LY79DRAFT_582618 [Colletotrichum navitas]
MSDSLAYAIGWICTSSTEFLAAQYFLDEVHQALFNILPRDSSIHTCGRIGAHNVVIAAPPGDTYGPRSTVVDARWAERWLEHIDSLDHVDFERLPPMTEDQPSIQALMGLFDKDSAEHGPINDDQGDMDDDDSQLDEHDSTIDLHLFQSLIFGGPAFAKLCSAIKEALYSSDPPHMRHIEHLIQDSLRHLPLKVCENCQSAGLSPARDSEAKLCVDHSYPYSVTLETDWKALYFLHAEFEKEVPSLGAVITYTGLASEAFATTCSQYLSEFWPSNSTALLDALDSLLVGRQTSKNEQSDENTAFPGGFCFS